jgi:hypothetical protein
VTLAARTVTVPARTAKGPSFVVVPMMITVPSNAQPGDHAGAVIASLASTIKSKTGQRFHLYQRVGSRIFLRIAGPLHPKLSIEHLTASYAGGVGTGKATVTFTVVNTGNVMLTGTQTVTVKGLIGSTSLTLARLPLLLPGGSDAERATLPNVLPAFWETATVTVAPDAAPGQVDVGLAPAQASVDFWAIPWLLVAIVVLLLLVAGWLWWRRHRGAPTGGHSGPGSNDEDEGPGPGDSDEVLEVST